MTNPESPELRLVQRHLDSAALVGTVNENPSQIVYVLPGEGVVVRP